MWNRFLALWCRAFHCGHWSLAEMREGHEAHRGALCDRCDFFHIFEVKPIIDDSDHEGDCRCQQ